MYLKFHIILGSSINSFKKDENNLRYIWVFGILWSEWEFQIMDYLQF